MITVKIYDDGTVEHQITTTGTADQALRGFGYDPDTTDYDVC